MFRLRLSAFATAAAFALLAGTASAGGVQYADMATAEQTLAGAEADFADSRAYLTELKDGNFAGIFVIADDGSMRCGEVEANPACAPLTDQDKAEALAEAEQMVAGATAQLEDATVSLASLSGVHNASMASAD